MLEIVKRPHVENFIEWSRNRPEVLVLSADLTNSCEIGRWRDAYPDRFFSMGMAEQNMMGVAAGLAREGYTPWIHTFAVFIYRRSYDQLAMSIAYPNLPARMVGFLPGIVTPGGVTHQAIEDIAIMRATPNMTILETGDATEVETVLDVAQAVDGPVYIRMLRGEMPRLFPKSEPFQLNKARVLSEGDDILLITSGIVTEEAIRATRAVSPAGVSVQHLHVSTLKPFNDSIVKKALSGVKGGVITMENHTIVGGLGSAVAELMAESACAVPLLRFGFLDTYAHGASRQYLMEEYELDAAALIRGVEAILKRPLNIALDALEEVRIEDMHSLVKAEAL